MTRRLSMREIKFRAVYKTDPAQLMFYQKLVGDNLYFLALNDPDVSYFYEIVMADDDWLKEQYTGLKDKNGKEIYEGDIVHLIDHPENITTRADVIVFEHGTFTTASETAVPLCDYGMVWVEVIGNIHENPELL
jgi:uncharacterized phage protein (TIGR01671 family)